ncbi:MAG: hypothetical protein M3347_15295, partial [Armatimonadota bacterium]|nr:hypothetical protein [Armatimonadota bacterium]
DTVQNTYACVRDDVWKIDAAGKIVNKEFITGSDWHPGRVYNPRSARVDANGNIYVLEEMRNGDENGTPETMTAEAARVSVFTKEGRLIRVWGRGGKAPLQDEVWPGQIYHPVDLAFGPNGNIYVVCPIAGGNTHVLAFQPF